MNEGFWEVVDLELPYPPSINHYYVRTRFGTAIGTAGVRYRKEVVRIASQQSVARMGDRKLAATIVICPPDRARRDLDNTLKALQDALTHAGVWQDDSDLNALAVLRGDAYVRPKGKYLGQGYEGGRVFLHVEPVNEEGLRDMVQNVIDRCR